MNAIFINAGERSVAAIELENNLQAMYDIIGCRLIQVVEYRDELIVCDEEARLKPWKHGFELSDWKICGNALILQSASSNPCSHGFSLASSSQTISSSRYSTT